MSSIIGVRGLTMAYGDFVLMRDLDFEIERGDVFVIMGGSGCGKSTLLKHMLGLIQPGTGDIFYNGTSFTQASASLTSSICAGNVASGLSR